MREQLSRTDANNRRDSLQLARRKASIDSLRSITAGAPLVIDGDTLLKLYARKGGMTPDLRVESAEKIINERGKSLTFFSDSCYVFEGEYFSDIMIGEDVILSISLEDALWENTTRQELANKYCKIIEAKVKELHADYGLQQKILGILFIVLILA